MAKTVRIFSGTTGLHTNVDPVRAGFDPKTGITDLTAGINIDVTDSQKPTRRKGCVKKSSTPGHSLFCDGGAVLFVTGSSLARLNPDFSHTILGPVSAPHLRMRYVQIGSSIYYGNGVHKGVFSEETGTAGDWVAPPSPSDVEVDYQDPVPPTHLEYYRGRLFTAWENILLYSAEWGYSWFDLVNQVVPFPSRITMIRRVSEGLYVGCERDGVFFCAGYGPDEFMVDRVSPDPPVEHTDVRVRADSVVGEMKGDAAMWTSKSGVCFGGSQRMFMNLTEDRVDLPPAMTGCAIANRSAYLSLINV